MMQVLSHVVEGILKVQEDQTSQTQQISAIRSQLSNITDEIMDKLNSIHATLHTMSETGDKKSILTCFPTKGMLGMLVLCYLISWLSDWCRGN